MNEETLQSLREIAARLPWLCVLIAALFGAAAGSFLNVCAFRIPRGTSIVRPGSRCECGAPVPWFRNIPVVSWLLLGGRAACCRRRLGLRHPLVEAGTAAWFGACWWLLPWQQAVAGMVFGAWLLALSLMDFDSMLLPDTPNIALAAAGALLALALPESHGASALLAAPAVTGLAPAPVPAGGETASWLLRAIAALGDSVTGALAGAGLAYWVRLIAGKCTGREALGEGDVILLGGIGAFCGWQGAVFALFGGSVLGTCVMLPVLLTAALFGKRRETAPPAETRTETASAAETATEAEREPPAAGGGGLLAREIPFGPWLALGAAVWWLFLRAPVATYIENTRLLLSGFAHP